MNEKFKYVVSGFCCGKWTALGETFAPTEKKAVSNIRYRNNLKPDGKGGYFGNGCRFAELRGKEL